MLAENLLWRSMRSQKSPRKKVSVLLFPQSWSLTFFQYAIAFYGRTSHQSYQFKRLLVGFWQERLRLRRSLASNWPKDISSAHKPKAGEFLPGELWLIIETSKLAYYHG
jgi:hypothetical protein